MDTRGPFERAIQGMTRLRRSDVIAIARQCDNRIAQLEKGDSADLDDVDVIRADEISGFALSRAAKLLINRIISKFYSDGKCEVDESRIHSAVRRYHKGASEEDINRAFYDFARKHWSITYQMRFGESYGAEYGTFTLMPRTIAE